MKFVALFILFSLALPVTCTSQNNFDKSRADSIIKYYGSLPYQPEFTIALAKLCGHQDIPTALQIIDTLTMKPRGEMFWFYQLMELYLLTKDQLPDEYKIKIRNALKNNFVLRGNTENHLLLYYTSLYLASETWPNEKEEQWFNGKSSSRNLSESREWILNWMGIATSVGQVEYDSPIYGIFYVTPLLMMEEFALDSDMKKKSGTMLNWLLADFAIDYLDGQCGGAHSRIKDEQVFNKRVTQMSCILNFWLGDKALFNKEGKPTHANMYLILPALCKYHPPTIFSKLITARDSAFESRESKPSENKIRYSNFKSSLIPRYTFTDKNYSLGSVQQNETGIQLQAWSLNWKAHSDTGITTMFGLHPYYSDSIVASFYPSPQKIVLDEVISSKASYNNENKWTGASPYEKLYQYKNTLIGLYDFSARDAVYKHYDVFFTKNLNERIDGPAGWVFFRDDCIYGAFKPLGKFAWLPETNGWRLRSAGEHTGFILIAESPDNYKSYEDFKTRIEKLESSYNPVINELQIVDLNKNKLEFNYKSDQRKLNGKLVKYDVYPLFESPFLHSAGKGKMEIIYKNEKLLLDLNRP